MKVIPCPCCRSHAKGQPLSLDVCCGPYHTNQNAPDAESLMRSRYSAFVLGDVPYLLATWHSSQRPATLELEAGAKWLGLDIKQHRLTPMPHPPRQAIKQDLGQPNERPTPARKAALNRPYMNFFCRLHRTGKVDGDDFVHRCLCLETR